MSNSRQSRSRPPSSASLRPPSSASTVHPHRPPSSTSLRPSSSASSQRPGSSLSTRPTSRVSYRSSRTPTKNPRIAPLTQRLVSQLTRDGTEEGDIDTEVLEWAATSLDAKVGVSQDMRAMDGVLNGHILKARINAQDELASALKSAYSRIKQSVASSESQRDNPMIPNADEEIKMTKLPDHLQLLILLSSAADPSTHIYASTYLHDLANPPLPPESEASVWEKIMREEPFEGDHWVGILDPASDESSEDITDDDMEDLERDSLDTLSDPSLPSPPPPQALPLPLPLPKPTADTYHHRASLEALQARQYWRPEWRTDASTRKKFNLGDAATLGPSIRRVLAGEANQPGLGMVVDAPENELYINEHDAVREVLMCLQGRKNIMMEWSSSTASSSSTEEYAFKIVPRVPRLIHLTLSSQMSILSSLAETASTLEHLRLFVGQVYSLASYSQPTPGPHKNGNTRTLEAFADALDNEVRMFDKWCAQREESICKAQAGIGEVAGEGLAVSLLNLEKSIRDEFSSSFAVLVSILPSLPTTQSRISSPASQTSRLLDTLFTQVQEHISMSDLITADTLMRVFIRSAEPVWAMVSKWLKEGMPVREGTGLSIAGGGLEEEFFVEDNEIGLLDPDFWEEGYELREGIAVAVGDDENGSGNRPKTIPIFLAHVAVEVLSSGKATGLLRALGIPPTVDGTRPPIHQSFGDLLISNSSDKTIRTSLSTDTLISVVYDELAPYCQATGELLTSVLVEDCDLWKHLGAIEDLYLMRRGDAMSHFIDILFAKMDSQQPWSDFHFLNSAFGDVLDLGQTKWIEGTLVRFSYRGTKDRAVNRTIKGIEGLLVEYAVPFPLTYIFGPKVLQAYGSLFLFLLQIRRAKSVLERILVRGDLGTQAKSSSELKVFYAMRSKLSWFINTLLSFLTTYVIHTQLQKFHAAFRMAKSLDEMISLHNQHLDKIQSRCLLNANTSALHRAILSILDICLHFSDFFVSFAGDTTTHDISRHSIVMKRHRSRRQRAQRKNIIAFSGSLRGTDGISDDDSDLDSEDNLENATEPSYSMGISTASVEGGFVSRMDQMASELDGLVRFVRRGTESLAGGTGDAAPAFGVLAFALEDWDS